MSKIIEYAVRPVTRYIITRFEQSEYMAGCEGFGEFDSVERALDVAEALTLADPGAELFDHTSPAPEGSQPIRVPVSLPRARPPGVFT